MQGPGSRGQRSTAAPPAPAPPRSALTPGLALAAAAAGAAALLLLASPVAAVAQHGRSVIGDVQPLAPVFYAEAEVDSVAALLAALQPHVAWRGRAGI